MKSANVTPSYSYRPLCQGKAKVVSVPEIILNRVLISRRATLQSTLMPELIGTVLT